MFLSGLCWLMLRDLACWCCIFVFVCLVVFLMCWCDACEIDFVELYVVLCAVLCVWLVCLRCVGGDLS